MALRSSKPMQTPSDAPQASGHPNSYISALQHFSARAKSCDPQNRMIEQLRQCTDMELAGIGIERSQIEQSVYQRKTA